MTAEDYTRIRDLFDHAMTLPVSERRPFVDDKAPAGDPLRSELLAMVDAGDDSAFLAKAAAEGLLDAVRRGGRDLPSQIGNYKILRVLGRGGMGVVYLALRNDDVFRKVVALKVIGEALDAADTGHVERFKRERQILAGLDHPNIARILDGGNTDDGRPFYVMEYVAGSPIDQYCRKMNTDVPTRVRMMAQACDAIEYLHDNAITHRDIKPHNILVTLDGRVKLVDFGIAKVEVASGVPGATIPSGQPTMVQPTMIMTPGYASPEQIAGDVAGKSADIYSVAVVLYQLLTGRLPYADQNGRPNLDAQLSGKAPEPPSQELSKSSTGTPVPTEPRTVSYPDLDHVVLTALRRDPLQRYPTVQLLAEDLRRCLDGRPIGARSSSLTYSFGKFITRNRFAAAIVVLALMAAGAGIWLTVSARTERMALQAKEAELERFVARLNSNVLRWQEPDQKVAAAEKVADVQAANQLMASDSIRTLSERAPDPVRVKQLVGELRRILERADSVSRDQGPVRKEIALAFRKIGDFEKNAPLPQLADKKEAANSYRRAAAIAADMRSAEAPWADQQLTELSGLLAGLGSPAVPAPAAPAPPAVPLPAVVESTPKGAEPVPPAAPAPPRLSAPRAVTASEPPPPKPPVRDTVDQAARAELVQRLRSVSNDAERARRSIEALQGSLTSQGQVLRPDIATSLSAADGLIEDARTSLDANDLPTAEDYLRRAGFQLRKVFQAVGG
jgi:serine/threonine protein kinase